MLHNVSPDQLTAIAKNFKIGLDYAHALASAEHEFAPGDRKWKRLTEKLSAIQKRTLPSLSMAEQGRVGRLSANDIVTSLLAAKKELHNSVAQLKQHEKYRTVADLIFIFTSLFVAGDIEAHIKKHEKYSVVADLILSRLRKIDQITTFKQDRECFTFAQNDQK